MRIDFKAHIDEALRQGIANVRRECEKIAAGAKPPWFDDVAKFEAQQAEYSFASEGAKSGAPWPSLTAGEGNMESYVKWKRRNWPGRKMNVWRGDTRDSLRNVSNPDHIARVRGGAMEFGTRAKLAKKMQEGESHSAWQRAYLKENTPQPPRRKRSDEETGGALVRFDKKGNVKKTILTSSSHAIGKSRKWFTFWYKTIPARPIVRKSIAQIQNLKLAIGKAMTMHMAANLPRSVVQAGIAKLASSMRPDPRA